MWLHICIYCLYIFLVCASIAVLIICQLSASLLLSKTIFYYYKLNISMNTLCYSYSSSSSYFYYHYDKRGKISLVEWFHYFNHCLCSSIAWLNEYTLPAYWISICFTHPCVTNDFRVLTRDVQYFRSYWWILYQMFFWYKSSVRNT